MDGDIPLKGDGFAIPIPHRLGKELSSDVFETVSKTLTMNMGERTKHGRRCGGSFELSSGGYLDWYLGDATVALPQTGFTLNMSLGYREWGSSTPPKFEFAKVQQVKDVTITHVGGDLLIHMDTCDRAKIVENLRGLNVVVGGFSWGFVVRDVVTAIETGGFGGSSIDSKNPPYHWSIDPCQ